MTLATTTKMTPTKRRTTDAERGRSRSAEGDQRQLGAGRADGRRAGRELVPAGRVADLGEGRRQAGDRRAARGRGRRDEVLALREDQGLRRRVDDRRGNSGTR